MRVRVCPDGQTGRQTKCINTFQLCWKVLKTINTYRFFIVKIRVPTRYVCLRLKVSSVVCKKVVNLDLRTALIGTFN